jgi:hypothetical protein
LASSCSCEAVDFQEINTGALLSRPFNETRDAASTRPVSGAVSRQPPNPVVDLPNFRIDPRAGMGLGLLQLDDYHRQTVDESDQIRAARVKRAGVAEQTQSSKPRCSEGPRHNRPFHDLHSLKRPIS